MAQAETGSGKAPEGTFSKLTEKYPSGGFRAVTGKWLSFRVIHLPVVDKLEYQGPRIISLDAFDREAGMVLSAKIGSDDTVLDESVNVGDEGRSDDPRLESPIIGRVLEIVNFVESAKKV